MNHDATHDALLARVLTGELETDSREVRQRLERCARCRTRLEELRRTIGVLAEAGDARMRDVLEEARALDTPLRETAREALRRAIAAEPRAVPAAETASRPATITASGALCLAGLAAAVVLAVLVLRGLFAEDPGPSPGTGRPLVLDASRLELRAPVGDVDAYTGSQWSFERAPGGFYELRVWDAAVSPDAEPMFEVFELEDESWSPTSAEARVFPDAIRWEVRAFDGAMTRVDSAEGTARLR